jgi:uncharacterized membrane protein YcaP (DUF421 family)
MNWITGINWQEMFLPTTSPLEILLRGSIMYLGLFILLRVIIKRETGGTGMSDILVIVLIADAAQNGMAGEYKSITDGLLLVATILFWSFFIDWLGYRFPALEKILKSSPITLVDDGRLQYRNLRREFITESELMSKVRAAGIEDLRQVRRAVMESDGEITVISKEKSQQGEGKTKKKTPGAH